MKITLSVANVRFVFLIFKILKVMIHHFKGLSLHGGGGPQMGEVTCNGSPYLSCKRDQIKKEEIIWTGGLPHLSGLPHLPGVPHLHVNSP